MFSHLDRRVHVRENFRVSGTLAALMAEEICSPSFSRAVAPTARNSKN
jgi:hypothetical protein